MEKVSNFGKEGRKAEITNGTVTGTVTEGKVAGVTLCEPVDKIGAPGRN